jgi:hypothetical protein
MAIIHVVNSSDREWTRHRYVLWFGAYGGTRLMVWANDLDSALELAGEWLLHYAPGHVIRHDSEDLRTLISEAREENPDLSEDSVYELATADLTYTESGYIVSYEWGIDLEDPSRSTLFAFADAIGAEFSK